MKTNIAENIETAKTTHNKVKLVFCPAAPTAMRSDGVVDTLYDR